MEILSDQSSFSREMREDEGETGDANNLFLWSIVIVVLLGLNVFAWLFCMYVFGNPEVPFNYQLLTRMNKLDPIEGFEPVTAPRGKFHNVKQLYGDVYEYKDAELNVYNNILKRYYLHNYKEMDDVTFVSGRFQVLGVRPLDSKDVFPEGVAIRARAIDFPAGYLDLVLPTEKTPAHHYRPGDPLDLEESASCFVLLHVHRLEDPNDVVFTAVPLVKRDFETPAGSVLTVRPPERLNLETGRWPLSDEPSMRATPVTPAEDPSGESEGEAEVAEADAGEPS